MFNLLKIGLLAMDFNLILPAHIFAGPPFLTDAPEPVDYQKWEAYLFAGDQHTLWYFGFYWTW